MTSGPPPIPESNYLAPADVYRLGEKSMVVARNCQPPTDMCVKCGASSDKILKRTFYWHHPTVYLGILGGVLIYIILAVCLRKTMTFPVGLCALHLKRRRMWIAIGWLGFLGLFALGIYGFGEENFIIGFIGIFGGLALAIASVVGARLISPTKIDDMEGTFSGCAANYLDRLPK